MIIFTSRDNRFTRFIERNTQRLAGATVCRLRGHRHSRYVWGFCDRCCQSYRRIDPATLRRVERSLDALERGEVTPKSITDMCRHCGKGPDPDGDHSCPCPFSDAECPDHPRGM